MRRKKTFTLIELCVVAAIGAIIVTVVLATFAGGIRVYQKLSYYDSDKYEVLFAFEEFEKDIRNILNHSQIKFYGTSQQVSFAALIKAHDGKGLETKELGRVIYSFDPLSEVFMRTTCRYAQALKDTPEDYATSKVLTKAKEVIFSYYYALNGGELSWNPICNEAVCKGIKIELRFGLESELETRTIFVPIVEVK